MTGRCVLCGSESRPLTKVAIPAHDTGTRMVEVCADAEACVRAAVTAIEGFKDQVADMLVDVMMAQRKP